MNARLGVMAGWCVLLGLWTASVAAHSDSAEPMPSFVVVFADDLGYGDLGCYGSPTIRTPNLDRMAAEGVRFTSFYAQTVCGPSRSSLMTGCYPIRVARRDAQPMSQVHPEMHTQEITIAELLRDRGYKTACVGKWDLAGHRQAGFIPELMPTHQGFDVFFGTPASNDARVDLYRGAELLEQDSDMDLLTQRYTDEAVAFLRTCETDQPFFLYVAHTMPHTRLGASDAFRGRSRRGLYGDVVEELDASVGRLIDELRERGIEDNTYFFFISDNGPWYRERYQGGSAGPLRGAKTSTWEGGMRVPAIAWAPGRIKPGVVDRDLATTMDLLPTLCALAGARVPEDRVIDGVDITGRLHGDGATSEESERVFFYYQHRELQAVRSGPWKLHLPRPARSPGQPNWAGHIARSDVLTFDTPMLFNLDMDVAEQFNVADRNPRIVERLMALASEAKAELGHLDEIGSGARSFD